MLTRKLQAVVLLAAGSLLATSLVRADDQKQEVKASTIVTILPKKEVPGGIPQSALHLKVNGKETAITGFAPLHSPQSKVEMVVLIDDGARTSLGVQLKDVAKFIEGQQPGTKVAVAYMLSGRAVFAGPLTTDRSVAAHGLRLPIPGGEGIDSSPYFCISDLAKNWPSKDKSARREVVMISDGVDNYQPRYDPEDPYVQAAMNDAVRARMMIYAIYWRSQGFYDRTWYGTYGGQNLLAEVSAATGGTSYWEGMGNPVSFLPYFADINRRIDNQYELDFTTAVGNKPAIQDIKLTASLRAKVDAPQRIYVNPGAAKE